VITAVGHVPDVDHCVTPDLLSPGNVLMLIGSTETEFAGSHFDLVHGEPDDPGVAPAPDTDAATHYKHLHEAIKASLVVSCHDLSEGGLAVGLAEMCIGGRLGAAIDTLPHDDLATALFSESIGRLVVEVEERHVAAFKRAMDDDVLRLGTVTDHAQLELPGIDPIPLTALVDAFNVHAVEMVPGTLDDSAGATS
jgi:phosphoribosylformylglycinamidine synthase